MTGELESDHATTDPDTLLVSEILTRVGICVRFIPRSNEQTCDLRADDGHEQYFIEVKAFHRREETNTRKSRFLIREKSLIGIVRDRTAKANRQIRATASRDDDGLRLQAWIRHSPYAPEVHHMILGAVYGARMVLQTRTDGRMAPNVCLYFSHSDFFKYRTRLDGVIVLDSGRGEFHLNDHSNRVARARKSGIAQAFLQKNALRDAASLASEWGYLIADCHVDRNNEDAVCQYLERKYDLKRVIRMHSLGFEGIEFLPRDAE